MERLFSPCTRLYDILETQGRLEELRACHEAYGSALIMECLFSPYTRLLDVFQSRGYLEGFRGHYPDLLQELNLDVSTEELLSAERAFTYADLYAMLRYEDTVLWLTSQAAVARIPVERDMVYYWRELDELYHICIHADGKDIVGLARSPEHLLEICNVIVRLLAASVVHSVILNNRSSPAGALINAPTLASLMDQCQSLKVLTLHGLAINENHCGVLGVYSKPGLEIVLHRCKLTSAGASALAEVLGRNQGPTKLDRCDIDNSILADGLRGNSCLKSFFPCLSTNLEVGNRQVLAIADALKENKGLVALHIWHDFRRSDETWDALCDSLKTHPALQVLSLQQSTDRFGEFALAPAVITSRVQAIMDMLKGNMSIHTIHVYDRYRLHELFQGSVIPYLKTNRFWARVRAIQKTRSIAYRAKVLGRALLAVQVRTDPNRFWMLLSGNADVAFCQVDDHADCEPPYACYCTTATAAENAAAFACFCWRFCKCC
jgi:hypothetical protein